MSVTVLVHGPTRRHNVDEAFAITLDAPRIVLGRGDGSEVRIPDSSVSARHATLRQRGADYLLVDEGSTNGTRVGRVLLSPQSPRVVRSGEMARLGRTWVEFRVEPKLPTNVAALRAKEVALALVEAALSVTGEDGRPRVWVESESEDTSCRIDCGARIVVGRSREANLAIDDPALSRRHTEIGRRGDALIVRDLGSKSGTRIGGRTIETTDVVWKPNESLFIGSAVLRYEFEAANALAEIERAPDERVALRELESGDSEPSVQAPDDSIPSDDDFAAQISAEVALDPSPPPPRVSARPRWGFTDFAVVALALGVFCLSAVGYFVLLK